MNQGNRTQMKKRIKLNKSMIIYLSVSYYFIMFIFFMNIIILKRLYIIYVSFNVLFFCCIIYFKRSNICFIYYIAKKSVNFELNNHV